MATKAYVSGSHFYLEIEGKTEPLSNLAKDLEVWLEDSATGLYKLRGSMLGVKEVLLSELEDKSGTPYDLTTWTAFYENNTGFSRASGSEVGILDYNDLATATTPITITGGAGFIDLTNDGLGAFTNKLYAPNGVTDVYDVSTDLFDWSQLKLGDVVDIRLDLEVVTSSVNTEIDIFLLMADGGGSYEIPFIAEQNYKNTGTYLINRYNGIYMGDNNTLLNGAKFRMKSDKTCTIVVRGWYCKVIIK